MLSRFFQLKENGTTFKTEILAGVTTFMTMAYILAVNPDILSAAGMDKNAVFTATALSAAIATLVMALVAKLPFALASGMGLNAFFAYTVVLEMGYSWQLALTAVFIEGIIFIILTFLNIRELIINSIPTTIKHAVSAGIGLFIAFIGMQKAGIIVNSDSVLVDLGDMRSPVVLVAFGGLLVTGVLLALKVRGALLIGIFLATLAGWPFGITQLPEGPLVSLPPSLSPVFMKFDFSNIWSFDMLIILFTFLFIDMFDTVGTLIGVTSKAGMLDKDGNIPRVKQALFADATGTVAGALLGTSTVTTYAESAAGVAEGGKTGLTALSTAVLFVLALFFAPVFMMVPASATTPALIIVGYFMMSPILKINFEDYTEALPAFLTIIIMPLAYSIAEGIAFGMISFVLLKIMSGKFRAVTWPMVVLAVIFILKFVF
jgi:adenine/guanine/hypoxanthine permease